MRSTRGSFLDFLKKKGGLRLLIPVILGLVLLLVGAQGGLLESGGQEASSLEDQLAELCSEIDGVGECRVVITYYNEDGGFSSADTVGVSGVAVICRGGDSVDVRRRLTELLCSLFDIGANRVSIEKMK